jgi:sucrose phosphorylase
MLAKSAQDRILTHLTALYGDIQAQETWIKLSDLLANDHHFNGLQSSSTPLETLNSLDSILITYADQFQSPGQAHLLTLASFFEDHLKELITTVHLLPFFPYSSDDGFSVIDYKKIDLAAGNWSDLQPIRKSCRLMFDAVVNHISSQSAWFQNYLKDKAPYSKYFLTIDPDTDLSQVTRPRAIPLLTEVESNSGPKHVWTTFGPDQIDLNYENPEVLLKMIDILLFYIKQGALVIRLDAVAYLWKEIGTSCIHLPQTHEVIKLMRAVLDEVAPGVILITETNVPHDENISYFGQQLEKINGCPPAGDEAQMVYQFPLAPLVLHTFRSGKASVLTHWASSLEVPFSSATFLNFIASHDGIGIRPAEGLLTAEEIQGLVDQSLAHGGDVSYKTNPDGSQSVYELNITVYDMLNQPGATPSDLGLGRFLASQAIMLSLSGVPGIYVHSLFGSHNYQEGVVQTGRSRSINRGKFLLTAIEKELKDLSSQSARVFRAYSHLLQIRKAHPAFNPLAPQQILDLDERLFALLRTAEDDSEEVLCLINITDSPLSLSLDPDYLKSSSWVDLLTEESYQPGRVKIAPYQAMWLV